MNKIKKKPVGVRAAWIAFFAVISSAIIVGLFTYFSSKEPIKKTNITAKDSSTINIDNKKIEVKGDLIQGDKISVINEKNDIPQKNSKPSDISKNIQQEITNSPNSVQIAGNINGDINVNINTSRILNDKSKDLLFLGLWKNPCKFIIGTLGLGGETNQFANDLYTQIGLTDCPIVGIKHAIDFAPFNGVRIFYSTEKSPIESIKSIEEAFKTSKIEYVLIPDSRQPENTIYLFVGYNK